MKTSSQQFNQVPIDRATECMNIMCKLSNGIIGITRSDPARDKFCATWCEGAAISGDVPRLFRLEDDNEEEHILTQTNDLQSKLSQYENAVKKLLSQFERFNAFQVKVLPDHEDGDDEEVLENDPMLIVVFTGDVATEEISMDMGSAKEKGEPQ